MPGQVSQVRHIRNPLTITRHAPAADTAPIAPATIEPLIFSALESGVSVSQPSDRTSYVRNPAKPHPTRFTLHQHSLRIQQRVVLSRVQFTTGKEKKGVPPKNAVDWLISISSAGIPLFSAGKDNLSDTLFYPVCHSLKLNLAR